MADDIQACKRIKTDFSELTCWTLLPEDRHISDNQLEYLQLDHHSNLGHILHSGLQQCCVKVLTCWTLLPEGRHISDNQLEYPQLDHHSNLGHILHSGLQ